MTTHIFVGIALSAAVALSACATMEDTVSAGSSTQPLAETAEPDDPRPCTFVDDDGDGVCDHAAEGCKRHRRGQGPGFVDQDGDGVCDHAAEGCGRRGKGHGPNFVDQDGDGVCDRAAEGCGRRGKGHGPNFVDQDGDGVCDHRGRRGGGD